MIEIIKITLIVLLIIPASMFGAYGILLLYYGGLNKRKKLYPEKTFADDLSEPKVTIVIPTHNEEKIISKKIDNILSLEYPKEKLEVIFVDDSEDSTPERIQEYSMQSSTIHLIKFGERIGYSPSMIAGCNKATGEIIVLNDAASFLDVKAIKSLVRHFKDPRVGAVTGNDVILNAEEEVGKSESFYQKLFNFLRIAETNMDSTFYMKGEATAVRKRLIQGITMCSETFDTTAGLIARQKGYRVIFDPSAKFYEYAPRTHADRIKQKTIRAANLIKVLWRHRGMMFKPRYGKYGSLILPINFALLTFAPILIFVWSLLLVLLTFLSPASVAIVWVALGITLIFTLAFLRNVLITFLEFEFCLLKAIYQVIFTNKVHDKIDKVDSTRRF